MKGKTKTPSIPKPFSPRQMGGEPSPNIEGIKSSSRKEIPRIPSFTSATARSKLLSFPSKGRKPSSQSWGRMNSAAKVV